MERNSCGIATSDGICGRVAVEYVDIYDGTQHFRIWLCADHADMREQFLMMIGTNAS